MTAIGIMSLSEPGHINATIRLRNELLERGHDVRYIIDNHGNGEEEFYVERGLPVVRLYYEPNGTPRVMGFNPEIAVIESVLVQQAILAWHYALPTIKLSSTFSQRYDARLPPLTSDLRPRDSEDFPAQVEEAWRIEHSKKNRWKSETWYQQCLEFASTRGFPSDWLDGRAAIDVTFKLPELNLAPQELDFERDCSDLFYAGPCVELERDESGRAPIPRLPADRPIVCFALGTQTQRYSNVVERVSLVASAARLLPDVHFVWAWNGDDQAALPSLPDNFVQVSKAPQLALLRRASLMVTHGGLNSIKEALCFGVPPLVLPCDLDQPGNAARLEFHGYGRRTSWDTTPTELAASIRAALNDDVMRKRVMKLSERFAAALTNREALQAFQRCFEHSLRFRRQAALPPLSTAI